MPIPTYETLMLPLLRAAAHGECSVKSVFAPVASEFKLSEADLTERIPSQRMTVLASRLHWARFYLLKAGLIRSVRRGVIVATERGRSVLATPPKLIDVAFLSQYPEFREFQAKSRANEGAAVPEQAKAAVAQTPEEQIDAAQGVLTAALREQLVARILDAKPEFLERVILDLLLKMGYGGGREGAGIHLGATGDGGVDGLIKQDALGLDVIYVQAKCYVRGNVVSEEAVRGFAGALVGKGATKGVFVTTSHFSEPARKFARALLQQKIVLIDGDEFSTLLVRHDIGARTDRTVELKKIDLDYFDEEGEAEAL